MATDHELRVHREWIGLLQPVGLVVSPPALLAAQAFPDKNILKEQQALLALITPPAQKSGDKKAPDNPALPLAFDALATQVLGWKQNKLVGALNGPPLPEQLAVVLPEFGETLRPTYAVPATQGDDGEWMMLIEELPDGRSFDDPPAEEGKKWHASPQIRLERLLRETGVLIGILSNGRFVRLVYAPRGETSGHVTWPVHRLCSALDRDMLSALCMLLGSGRLFTLPREQRLPHILKESRKYQNVVSTKLAGQVLEALSELLRGFVSANDAAKGGLLDATVREAPDHIYGGLLAVLLRLVFILYAEERGLLSTSATYVRNYSLVALFEKLRIDAGRFPDTMDQRYGAWSRLLVLFRMVHDGAKRGDLRLPPRYGHLFDPDGWGFLEGCPLGINRVMGARVAVPKVPDGVVLRVLEKLLLLEADRLSYRALDVEQIGSVYENMMGFRLEQARETSIGVGSEHVVVALDTLLTKSGAERVEFLKKTADVELSGRPTEALKEATTIDDLIAALSRRISPLTPRTVPAGGLYLQPTDERRRSGSHYTPRELTEPIVRTTLWPILEELGASPKPKQILSLKVCDPAMGSGAFLVEACRQLAQQLVKAYDVHGRPTDVPPEEDLLLYAQRQVAQHCLYGVDKNPFAVDLGKLSLWLATLARDHAFTFLDHSIRHGDSLVGLTREQIASFHWAPEKQIPMIRTFVDKSIAEAIALRARIPDLANSDDVREKRQLLRDADDALTKVRMVADAVVACFFKEEKSKTREEARERWETIAQSWLSSSDSSGTMEDLVAELRAGAKPVPCFHWEIEFPEIFDARSGGFHAIVGNPPFMGGHLISGAFGLNYFAYLTSAYSPAGHYCDLVAYFYRSAFDKLRAGACFGLLATQTIAHGDTRHGGLRQIVRQGGMIYSATRRIRWPGKATVIVSAVSVRKGRATGAVLLDSAPCARISAFLLGKGGDDDPEKLVANTGQYSKGSQIYGQGFLFDDDDAKATPLSEMKSLLKAHPECSARIFPFIGGQELTQQAVPTPRRWVIYLSDLRDESELGAWTPLVDIVRAKVKPERDRLGDNPVNKPLKRRWWAYQAHRPDFYGSIKTHERVLAISEVTKHLAFAFLPTGMIYSHKLILFVMQSFAEFGVMQSQLHEIWVRTFSAPRGDAFNYAASDCFLTYPLPQPDAMAHCDAVSTSCYELRQQILRVKRWGLTELYNAFHDPDQADGDLIRLREAHGAMDRGALDAYGWSDIEPACDFVLDFEEEDDDAESSPGRRKKKPWRYRWTDDVRDEVLARLLELNAQRANDQTGSPGPAEPATPSGAGKKPRYRAKGKKPTPAGQGRLFGEDDE